MRAQDQESVTRFAQARGARLDEQVLGSRDPAVVAIELAEKIHVSWSLPLIRRMLEEFGSFCRCLHVDKRGSGAVEETSARAHTDPTAVGVACRY